ncbi:MAG: nuclear transport factor 2 family protein [Gammaproteobacteria bacterium]|nr:nuclear transport factor 2 family protein [Gammaproteobacteria bacterium]
MNTIVKQFCDFYINFDKQNLQQLELIYRGDISFTDPAHHIGDLKSLIDYFSNMMTQVDNCQFTIHKVIEDNDEAFIQWQMMFSHPSLNKQQDIKVDGVSHIRFDEKIYFHRDYFDMGSMLYEHIPMIGFLIKKIKNRLNHE